LGLPLNPPPPHSSPPPAEPKDLVGATGGRIQEQVGASREMMRWPRRPSRMPFFGLLKP
jgi:hypothetical protein